MKKNCIYCFLLLLTSVFYTASAQDKMTYTRDPDRANFVFSDIDHFYQMLTLLDKARSEQDSINTIQRFYIDLASNGLKEYLEKEETNNRRSAEKAYLNMIRNYPEYLWSLKNIANKLPEYFPLYRAYFHKIKEIYPQAIFPDTYFSFGFLNVGGQMLNSRLLFIAIEGTLIDEHVNYHEFPESFSWLQEDAVTPEALAYLIVHENLHAQQQEQNTETLLSAAIKEGAAVFITELICGEKSLIGPAGLSQEMIDVGKKDEKNLWNDFVKDVKNNDRTKWFFNDNGKYPYSMGYYMGYMICKDFYENSEDKSEALRILIHGSRAELIYQQSRYSQ